MANEKIIQIKFPVNGTDTVFDLDLPSTATPSITSLTTSGNITVGGSISEGGTSLINKYALASSVYPPLNNVRSNLGDPSVYETGIIDSEFTNKLMNYEPSYIKIYRSNDGTTLTEATEYTDNHKKALLIGDANTSLSVEVGKYLVIEITAKEYVYLNMLYTYNSTSGTTFQYKIEKSWDKTTWVTHVNYSDTTSTWPGHTVLRHDTIPFNNGGTQGTHWKYIRLWIKCNQVSSSYSTGYIYKLQWWGGYPSGRRTYYYIDENKNYTFPATVSAVNFTENGTALSSKYLSLSGGSVTGDLKLYAESGDSPRLTFQRGTLTDTYNDWSLYDSSGYLYIQQRGNGSTVWETRAVFDQNSVNFTGAIYENGTSISTKYLQKASITVDSDGILHIS